MDKVYKEFMSLDGTQVAGVILNGTIAIPANPDNTDYQAYLKWLEEGNTPLPAIIEDNNNSTTLNVDE